MKKTALYDQHIKHQAKMVEFAGYEMPIQYSGISDEHHSVRQSAGLFDVSHMGEFIVEGEDAGIYLDYMLVNDVLSMKDGQIIYSPMCYEDGGTVDDLLVYRMTKTRYLIVVNASNMEKDYEWFENHIETYHLGLSNHSQDYGLVALQGPKAEAVLQALCDTDLSLIDYYHFKEGVIVAGAISLVSRTGYTGEDGFEILAKNEDISGIFEAISRHEDVTLCGLGARDTLRFEAAMPLYGHELTRDINPLEAGLNYFIKKDRDFIGKSALDAYRTHKKRKLVGLELIGKGIARQGYRVLSKSGDDIGFITTGYKSPTLNKALAFALISSEAGKLDQLVDIQIRNKLIEAKVVKRRFLK